MLWLKIIKLLLVVNTLDLTTCILLIKCFSPYVHIWSSPMKNARSIKYLTSAITVKIWHEYDGSSLVISVSLMGSLSGCPDQQRPAANWLWRTGGGQVIVFGLCGISSGSPLAEQVNSGLWTWRDSLSRWSQSALG